MSLHYVKFQYDIFAHLILYMQSLVGASFEKMHWITANINRAIYVIYCVFTVYSIVYIVMIFEIKQLLIQNLHWLDLQRLPMVVITWIHDMPICC